MTAYQECSTPVLATENTGPAAPPAGDLETGRTVRRQLLAGLQSGAPAIPSKYFYDEAGSALFGQICELPEYYLTRTEVGILTANSRAIASTVGRVDSILEPGAGNCEKIRYLLPDLMPEIYVPVDISAEYLRQAAHSLRGEFPGLRVQPVVTDFSRELALPGTALPGRRLLFYPGSTIGNFEPPQALEFLRHCAQLLGDGGGLLIGVDLHKDSSVLNAAYNDARGLTAAFNRNILQHVNRILDADFQPRQFEHLAFYNEAQRRVEMHLVSSRSQTVQHREGSLAFAAGDRIHTEYSCKYSPRDFVQLAAAAGWQSRACWIDPQHWFSVHYFEAAGASGGVNGSA